MTPRCAECDRKLDLFTVPSTFAATKVSEPPHCIECDVVLCPPVLRDCASAHWNKRHVAKPIVEVKGP